MRCIKCGSSRVAPILYGMPAFSEELEEKLNNEKLYLGGCCLTGADPKYHCFKCKKDFGTPPVLISKQGQEDYRNIVTAVKFSIGGFFGGYNTVEIIPAVSEEIARLYAEKDCASIFEDLPLMIQVYSGYEFDKPALQRAVTQDEWKKLLNQLFCRLYIHDWRRSYRNNQILDGEEWELEISFTKGRCRTISGSNAYPPYWNRLKAVFRPFFKEAGVEF